MLFKQEVINTMLEERTYQLPKKVNYETFNFSLTSRVLLPDGNYSIIYTEANKIQELILTPKERIQIMNDIDNNCIIDTDIKISKLGFMRLVS